MANTATAAPRVPTAEQVREAAGFTSAEAAQALRDADRIRYASLLAARRRTSEAISWITSKPRAAWHWLVQTFHLEGVVGAASRAVSSIRGFIGRGYNFVARNMGIPATLSLAVSTHTGREVLGATVGRVLSATGSVLGWCYDKTITGLHKLGRPGQWVANQFDDIVGTGLGWAGKTKGWYDTNVAPLVHPDTLQMKVVRDVATLTIARRLMMRFLPPQVRTLLYLAVGLYGAYQVFRIARVEITKTAKDLPEPVLVPADGEIKVTTAAGGHTKMPVSAVLLEPDPDSQVVPAAAHATADEAPAGLVTPIVPPRAAQRAESGGGKNSKKVKARR